MCFTVNACYLKNISILNLDTFVNLSARNNNSYCPTHKAKKNGRHFQNNRSNFLSMIIYSTTVILLFCCILTHKRCHLILYKARFSRFLETMFSQNICFQWYHIHKIHTKSPYHRTPVQHCYPVRYLDRYSLCKSLGTK